MFAPPLFGSCSHIGLAVFSRPPAGLHRPDSSDRFRAGSGPISMRVATDLGAEYDRSRRGLRPISMRVTTDLGGFGMRVRSHPARPLAFCAICASARVLRRPSAAHSCA